MWMSYEACGCRELVERLFLAQHYVAGITFNKRLLLREANFILFAVSLFILLLKLLLCYHYLFHEEEIHGADTADASCTIAAAH